MPPENRKELKWYEICGWMVVGLIIALIIS